MSTAIAKAFGLDKAENTRQARESFYDRTADVARVAREMVDTEGWHQNEQRDELRQAVADQLAAQERMLAAMTDEDAERESIAQVKADRNHPGYQHNYQGGKCVLRGCGATLPA